MRPTIEESAPLHGQEVLAQYGESLVRAVYNAQLQEFILKDGASVPLKRIQGWSKLPAKAVPEVFSI